MINTERRAILFRVGGLGDLLVALPAIALARRSLPGYRLTLAGRPEYALLLVRAGLVDEAMSSDDLRMMPVFGHHSSGPDSGRETGTGQSTDLSNLNAAGPGPAKIFEPTGVSLAMGWWNTRIDWPSDDWWTEQGIGRMSFVTYDGSSGQPMNRFFFDRTSAFLATQSDEMIDPAADATEIASQNRRAGTDRALPRKEGIEAQIKRSSAIGDDPDRLFDSCARLDLPSARVAQALAELSLRPVAPGEMRLVVHPGSGGRDKRWPLADFLEVVRHAASTGIGGVLVTGEAEDDLESSLRAVVLPAGWTRVSRLPAETLAGLLASSTHYIGNDSGPTHLAAACGARVLAFFLDTNLPAWRPFGRTRIISAPAIDRILLPSVMPLLGDFLAS